MDNQLLIEMLAYHEDSCSPHISHFVLQDMNFDVEMKHFLDNLIEKVLQ
jgi:hypothetical protein